MNIQKVVGINLKYLRFKSNMSQEEFYSKYNLNVKYMASMERGVVNFKIKYLEWLADKLKVNVYELLTFDETHIISKTRIDGKVNN